LCVTYFYAIPKTMVNNGQYKPDRDINMQKFSTFRVTNINLAID
jgi:hypothetical protein